MENTSSYDVSYDKAVEMSWGEEQKRVQEWWSWKHGGNPKFLSSGGARISDVGMQSAIFMHNDVRYKKFIIMTMKLYIIFCSNNVSNNLVTLMVSSFTCMKNLRSRKVTKKYIVPPFWLLTYSSHNSSKRRSSQH